MQNTHLDNGKKENTHELAVDRTVFAFERTALAYFRTAATFLIAGMSLIRFFEERFLIYFGFLLLPIAGYMFIMGVQKFRELNRFIQKK